MRPPVRGPVELERVKEAFAVNGREGVLQNWLLNHFIRNYTGSKYSETYLKEIAKSANLEELMQKIEEHRARAKKILEFKSVT